MHLREMCVVHDSEDLLRECQIYVKMTVTRQDTYVQIRYLVEGDDNTKYIHLEWPTNVNDPPFLTIGTDRVHRFCWVFQREETEYITLEVQDTPENHWCYFPDVRYHLYRISP
jgi:hypothetical protein